MGVIFTVLLLAFLFWASTRKNGSHNSMRKEFLEQSISELQTLSEPDKDKTIRSLLLKYKKELKDLSTITFTTTPSDSTRKSAVQGNLQEDHSEGLHNWYSENSINLLLYVGAFLIVASASIFIGFQWGSIAGIIKALMITGVTAAFIMLGLIFCRSPKIQQAGMVFTSIGALLIPMSGIAFFKFVFEPQGVPGGVIWMLTSAVMLLFYIFLIHYFNKSFFTYLSSIAAVSMAFSFVNLFHFTTTYYILAGIISAFMILFSRLLINKESEQEKLVAKPLEIASNIILLFSVIFGLIQGAVDNKLFTVEGTVCALLVTVYFFISYSRFRYSWQFILGLIFLPLTFLVFFQWQSFNSLFIIYFFKLLSFGYIYLLVLFQRRSHAEEANGTQVIALVLNVFTFIAGMDQLIWHRMVLTALSGVQFYLLYFITKSAVYIVGGTLSLALLVFQFSDKVLVSRDRTLITSMLYAALGVVHYVLAVLNREVKHTVFFFGLSVGLFFLLSLITADNYTLWLAGICLILGVIFLSASYRFSKLRLIYLSNFFLYGMVYFLLLFFKVEDSVFPLIFTAVSFLIYALSFQINQELREKYQNTAYGAQVIMSLFFFFDYGFSEKSRLGAVQDERNALIATYASVILFGTHAYITKRTAFAYAASASLLLLYFWQIHYLGIEQLQAYTVPAALYFMALAYSRKVADDATNRQVLDVIGLGILLFPTLIQSFSHEGTSYSLLMGAEGVVLLILGISWAHTLYKYAGITAIALAVLSQTYVYILDIPRWLLTGVVGIIFLVFAVYLLLNRKDK